MKETIHQWADKFLKSSVQPMSGEVSKMFLQISMGMPDDVPLADIVARSNGDFGVAVLAGRVADIHLDLTGQVFAMIRVLCNSPGDLVMWAIALRSWQIRNNNRQVTMDVLSMELFPMGFPTTAALSEAWGAQKDAAGFNLVDRVINSGILKNEEKTDAAVG